MAEGPATPLELSADVSSSPNGHDMQILLLGRTGSGKSSSGNTILGQNLFEVPKNNEKHEAKVRVEVTHIDERQVHVIDTTDLKDPKISEEKFESEKVKLLSVCTGGLSAVLLVVPLDTPVKNEEEILDFIKCLLGPEVQNYCMVLFTFGDELDDNQTIDEHLQNQDHADLQQLVIACGGTFHCFNNNNKVDGQVTELLHKIDRMVTENSGKFLTQQSKRRNSKEDPPSFSADKASPEFLIPEQKKQLRLVLLGTTGVGKSAAGNTLLGKNMFQSSTSSNSQTKHVSFKTTERFGKNISVIDTPGLYDKELSEEEVQSEIMRCIIYSSPGPHVFLIVIKLGRFTEEEKKTVEQMKLVFGKEFEKYTMILFTHKDQLQKENKTIEEFLWGCDADLQNLLRRCGNRYFCLDNNSASYPQVKEFLSKIEMMVEENGGTHFTNDMFEEIENHICKFQKQKLEDNIRDIKGMSKVPALGWYIRSLTEEARTEALKLAYEIFKHGSSKAFSLGAALIMRQTSQRMCAIQ